MQLTPEKVPALLEKHGSLRAIGRAHGWSNGKVQNYYRKAVRDGIMQPIPMGNKSYKALKAPKQEERRKALKPKRKRHHTFIITSAQNNTLVNDGLWQNLLAFAKSRDAEILVSTFLYARRGIATRLDKAKITRDKSRDQDDLWFDPKIVPYICNDRVEIANGLVFCGELNISPTAERPLSGLEVYTGRASMIVPHTKLAMQSIATVGGSGTKFNWTTGTVTQRNYIQRKEGFKAEFHHCYGALLVELDEKGNWWVRQLNAETDGTFFDLTTRVKNGKMSDGHRAEAIVFGDCHVDQMDPEVKEATWGRGGLVDTLRPRFQFIHDVLDFYRRSHHEAKDPYKMLKRFVEGKENVREEVDNVAKFLNWISRKDSKVVVVDSNHDRAMARWLRDQDGRRDPVNAAYWSWLNNEVVRYITNNNEEPNILKLAIFDQVGPVRFLNAGDSFVICPDEGGGIECGLHGDQGPNGARGAIRSFSRMGRRTNIGHSHTAGIDGGAWQAGHKMKPMPDYARGSPSSWSHTDIIVYENSKRAMVTFFGGKWRR